MNIEATDADQVFVDDGVALAVVDDVIDVTVNVVVHPAGGDGEAVFVVGARHLRIVGAAKVAKVRAPLPLAGGGVGGEGDGGSGTTRIAPCHVPPLPNPLPPGEREPNRTFVAFAAPTSCLRSAMARCTLE